MRTLLNTKHNITVKHLPSLLHHGFSLWKRKTVKETWWIYLQVYKNLPLTFILFLLLTYKFITNAFRFAKNLKDNITRWRCTVKTCKAYLKYDVDDDIIESNVEHTHLPLPEQVGLRREISNGVKRKARNTLNDRPKKLIRENTKNFTDTLTAYDVKRIYHNLYYEKRKHRPVLPQNISEVHDALDVYDLKTCRGEPFLLKNDKLKNYIIFSCQTNIEILRNADKIYIDGTFKCCAKYFYQMFTIHILLNGHA